MDKMIVHLLRVGEEQCLLKTSLFPSVQSCIVIMCDSPCGDHAVQADFMLSDDTLGLILH